MTPKSRLQHLTKRSRVFISHSSNERDFANLVQSQLQSSDMSAWIDSEQISTGDDILEQMGKGLRTMDILVVLISNAALSSRPVSLEVEHGIWREAREKQVIVLPFIVDDTPIDSIRDNDRLWFLGSRRLTRIAQDAPGAEAVADSVRTALKKRSKPVESRPSKQWQMDPRIKKIIRKVSVIKSKVATGAAILILKETNEEGNNEYFQALVTSLYHLNEGNLRWGAIQTIESIATLAPWMFDHSILARMANHSDFTIRSLAASICMDFAQFAPERVPLDVAFRLSRYDEDWYVMAPALAALKALVRPMPGILGFFYQGLHDNDSQAREHAANAIYDIARHEPDLLDPVDLKSEISYLQQKGDEAQAKTVAKALARAKKSMRSVGYKYGL